MEKIELDVKERKLLGKKVRFLRRQGYTPANLYGYGLASTAIQAPTKELQQVIHHAGKSRLVGLRVDGRAPIQTLIRSYQQEPTTHRLLHVDFFGVRMGEKIKISVPIVFVGEAPGLKAADVVVVHGINTLEVESLPEDLPAHVEVDLSPLTDPDQAIHVRDLIAPKGVNVLTDADELVAKLNVERPEVEEVVEEVQPEAAETVEESKEGAET